MALIGSAAAWKTAVIATLDITDLSAGEISILEAFWLSVCQVHETHIVANALISTIVTGTCNTGPITGVGTGTPPVTGIL